jgi:hypothetical protein
MRVHDQLRNGISSVKIIVYLPRCNSRKRPSGADFRGFKKFRSALAIE